MNGSADCGERSLLATDEEPPGPLDLSSSILSTDFAYDARSTTVHSTLGFAGNGRHALPVSAPLDGPLHSPGLPFEAAQDDLAISPPPDNLAFLRRTTNAKTRTFRRLHFPDVTTRDWNDWRWQS